MIVSKTARYWGRDIDYWEDNLTLSRHRIHEKEYAIRPPPEFFLAVYFQAHGWWTAPDIDGRDAEALEKSLDQELENIVDFSQ